MTTKQKLELTWIGKEKRLKLEPRILLEYTEKSYPDLLSIRHAVRGELVS